MERRRTNGSGPLSTLVNVMTGGFVVIQKTQKKHRNKMYSQIYDSGKKI
jgi:hypothetical protein